MNRYAWIVWLGGGILGNVAGQMVLEDRLLRGWSVTRTVEYELPGGVPVRLHPLPLALAAAIVIVGWWRGRQRRPRVPENV
jgi:hypothetical protein